MILQRYKFAFFMQKTQTEESLLNETEKKMSIQRQWSRK